MTHENVKFTWWEKSSSLFRRIFCIHSWAVSKLILIGWSSANQIKRNCPGTGHFSWSNYTQMMSRMNHCLPQVICATSKCLKIVLRGVPWNKTFCLSQRFLCAWSPMYKTYAKCFIPRYKTFQSQSLVENRMSHLKCFIPGYRAFFLCFIRGIWCTKKSLWQAKCFILWYLP